jgi:hypothetical protein
MHAETALPQRLDDDLERDGSRGFEAFSGEFIEHRDGDYRVLRGSEGDEPRVGVIAAAVRSSSLARHLHAAYLGKIARATIDGRRRESVTVNSSPDSC